MLRRSGSNLQRRSSNAGSKVVNAIRQKTGRKSIEEKQSQTSHQDRDRDQSDLDQVDDDIFPVVIDSVNNNLGLKKVFRRKSLSGNSSYSNSSGIETISSCGSSSSSAKKSENSHNPCSTSSELTSEIYGSSMSFSSSSTSNCHTPSTPTGPGGQNHQSISIRSQLFRERSNSIAVKNGQNGQNSTPNLTLEIVIDDKTLRPLFYTFLCSEHSEESLQFILSVKKLYTLANSTILSHLQLKSKAKHVFETYVKEGSEREVNLLYKTRISVDANLKLALGEKSAAKNVVEIPLCFQAAKDEIMALLRRDSWPRFLKSHQ